MEITNEQIAKVSVMTLIIARACPAKPKEMNEYLELINRDLDTWLKSGSDIDETWDDLFRK